MKIEELFWGVASGQRWTLAHRDADFMVVEVKEGLIPGRSQFVEIYPFRAGEVSIERVGSGDAPLTMPSLVQLVSRVAGHSGGFYDATPEETSRIVDVVLNDFRIFGHVRIHPHHCITTVTPLAGLDLIHLESLILAIGYVADRVEHTLTDGRGDQY